MTHLLHDSCTISTRDSSVAAVGNEWIRFREEYPLISLHSPDGNHARPVGSYLAAMVIYRIINPSARFDDCTRPQFIDEGEFEALLSYSKINH
jgi:hypothetical protein